MALTERSLMAEITLPIFTPDQVPVVDQEDTYKRSVMVYIIHVGEYLDSGRYDYSTKSWVFDSSFEDVYYEQDDFVWFYVPDAVIEALEILTKKREEKRNQK